ncbi:Z804A protein, partial [Centropus bengalensis]|nr:Z804A protein [Centropus bengalensis]
DYAEKKNTIAKALEDLKANFYCGLCDKQYYKHQEFDNHINSYDHAHKQRLKELKQREFARNVASKSRKDERKQEKALQRLHKLAELRKETACAPGSGPMFRSTTVTVQDHGNDVPPSPAIDSACKQDFSCTLTQDAQNCKDVASDVSSTPGNTCSNKGDANKCGDQVQGTQGHRFGFSFAFPKKAVVKLESSAAVFYEYNDESSMEHGFSRRSRFLPGTCNLQSPSAAEIVLCPEERHNCLPPVVEKCTDAAEAPKAQDPEELPSKEGRLQQSPILIPAVPHSKQLVSLDVDGVGVSTADSPDQTLPVVVDGAQVPPLDCRGDELPADRALVQAAVEDCSSLQDIPEENAKDGIGGSSTSETEIRNLGADALVPSPAEEGSIGAPQSKPDTRKRPCDPFVPILSKYGTNILQWPSEMLFYTSTDPSISYSCNPLYFDFKSSRASDSQEKAKQQTNIPHLHHKTESNHSLVSDFSSQPSSECDGYEAKMNKNVCNYTMPFISDVSLLRNCDLAKSQHKVSLGESFRIGKTEKYHISKSHLRQNTVIDEKYNKVWIKESHEKWLHKSRKRKRRRKLCHCHHHHHCGESTAAEMEMFSVTGKEISYRDESRCQHLPHRAEKCGHDLGSIWLAAGVIQRSQHSLSLGGGRGSALPASGCAHGDSGWCPLWGAGRGGCKGRPRGSKSRSRGQAERLAPSCGGHGGRRPRARCGCGAEQSCAGAPAPSVKRSHSSATEQPDRAHRKRRPHSPSSSSSEGSCGPAEPAPHRAARGKRRRRKTKPHGASRGGSARKEPSPPSRESGASPAPSAAGG